MTIDVRPMAESDRAFVLDSWIESEEEHARIPGSRDDVFASLRGKARRLLARSRVLVAHPHGDGVTVLAWLAVDLERPVVHYAYTRRQLRRSGLQRALVDAAKITGPLAMTCAVPKKGPIGKAHYQPIVGWTMAAREA